MPKTTFDPVLIAWLLRTKDVVYFSYSDPNNQASSGSGDLGGGEGRGNCKSTNVGWLDSQSALV